ncbi:DUF2764 family protein [Legionella cardiaca]|uniref:DUF2764 family protein n=1 Tax=Legionella cardiaca TaxID=1071983 RepID=A0ABY8AV17_9GAMM|nr:DUF2764 family protein [Legionella cardiaca]WED43360.1 DUF2764 family protein [Legionella cardiaca]
MTQQFYMIVSSLPRMNTYFKIEETPISRLQLEKRLQPLSEEKRRLLYEIESLLWTSWFKPQQTVNETRKAYQRVLKSDSAFVHNIVTWYLDLRSVFSAIRMRNDKELPPEIPKNYWITRWDRQLIRNWNEPDFGLKFVYPWITRITTELAREDTATVEEFLLAYIWKYLAVIETGHYFDFEALVIYLLRWDIINYWSKFNNANVLNRVNELVDSLIHEKH